MSEKEFMNALEVKVSAIPGVRIWRQPAGKILTDKGTAVQCAPVGASDLTGIVGPEGWRLEIECKMRRKKRTRQQGRWAKAMRERGAIYLLAVCDERVDIDAEVLRCAGLVHAMILGRRAIWHRP